MRVTTADGVHLVADEEFTAASPDPLYDDEDGLVAHLEANHRDALVGWVLDTLPAQDAQQTREVAVVGADRHGLDVLVTVGRARRPCGPPSPNRCASRATSSAPCAPSSAAPAAPPARGH